MVKKVFFGVVILIILFIVGRYYYLNIGEKVTTPTTAAVEETYEGTLPCADCEGIHTTLTLRENPPTFTMNQVYAGTPTTFDQDGTWNTTTNSAGETVYILTPTNPNESKTYLLKDDNAVTMLDGNMNKIDSDLNFTLTKKQ